MVGVVGVVGEERIEGGRTDEGAGVLVADPSCRGGGGRCGWMSSGPWVTVCAWPPPSTSKRLGLKGDNLTIGSSAEHPFGTGIGVASISAVCWTDISGPNKLLEVGSFPSSSIDLREPPVL